MASTRSGYVVEVPLGLWSSVGFCFYTDPGGDIIQIEALLLDDDDAYSLPPALRDFAAGYMKTWLTTMRRNPEGFEFHPQDWIGHEHWQDQTTERLAVLCEKGAAVFQEDLDDWVRGRG